MEIERKFIIPKLPDDLEDYPHTHIWQGYLCARPTVRIRCEEKKYTLTYKGKGMMAREEYNLPLSKKSFQHLAEKIDGCVWFESFDTIAQYLYEKETITGEEFMDILDLPQKENEE